MQRPVFAALLSASLAATAGAQQPVRVGLAFDTGGKGDHGFNQSSWEGARRAAKDFGVQLRDFSPADGSQVGQGIRGFASADFDMVIGVGFANQPSITAAAKDFSGTRFAVVDDMPKGDNTTGLLFREQEGSFLVGFIAGKTSSTGTVGFVGGMDIPLIHKFEAGYRAGVLAACKGCRVVAQYVGTTPSAWNDPAKAKEIAASLKARGADIVFAAAGASGLGVIDYVKQTKCLRASGLPKGMTFRSVNVSANVPKPADYKARCASGDRPMFFIGVDSNQNYLGDSDGNPATLNYGLTSMLKRVDNAVYAVIRDMVKGEAWRSGSREFALGNDGVGYALDKYNKALLPALVKKQVELVKKLVIDGTIKVPAQ